MEVVVTWAVVVTVAAVLVVEGLVGAVVVTVPGRVVEVVVGDAAPPQAAANSASRATRAEAS
jgi:hypothetical protein